MFVQDRLDVVGKIDGKRGRTSPETGSKPSGNKTEEIKSLCHEQTNKGKATSLLVSKVLQQVNERSHRCFAFEVVDRR
ncbi:hypothetical protein RE6C_00614 [Rhodopirellula europaea 6C]|uniref:Uncharacterized protein n=1 Tax=Rhodopirellula europaea 6C TaxID=1263867 RepID=M2ANC2_9BACT|nr:hypothetical protein RE6C_00614 [Rhodopirellula europaea 6C]